MDYYDYKATKTTEGEEALKLWEATGGDEGQVADDSEE